jgi:hypothetical protein
MNMILRLLPLVFLMSVTAAAEPAADAAPRIFVYQSARGQQGGAADQAAQVTTPVWIPAAFGVEMDILTDATIGRGWEQTAAAAPLWMLTRSDILRRPETPEALAAFLRNGGTLYLHHLAFPLDAAARKVLEDLGVRIPARERTAANYHVVVNAAEQHPLVRAPHDLVALMEKDVKFMPPTAGRDAFFVVSPEDAAAGVRPLMFNRDDPGQVAMAVQEGVQGGGRVIVTAMPVLNLRPRVYNFDRIIIQRWTENLLTLVFGTLTPQAAAPAAEEEVATETQRLALAYPALDFSAEPAGDINPLYLRAVRPIPWWDQRWAQRLAVLVYEPSGVARAALPATIALDIGTATPDSIRVVTPWGERVPFQAWPDSRTAGTFHVTFAADYLAYEHRVFFVYFDGGEPSEPDAETDLVVREHDDRIELLNARLRAVVRRDEPRLVYLAPRFNPTDNQLHDFHGMWPDGSPHVSRGMTLSPARPQAGRVVERGPVRAVVEYPGADGRPAVTITLDAGARRLEWQAAGTGLSSATSWMPGRGGFGLTATTAPDMLHWTQDGVVKHTPVQRAGALLERGGLARGDWYAFEDTQTGQTVGEVFDGTTPPALTIGQDDMAVNVDVTWAGAGRWRGGWIPLPEGSGYLPLSREARSFRHRARVLTMARAQPRGDAPAAPRVPVFGRDLIRGYHDSLAARGRPLPVYTGGDAPWDNIPHLIRWAESRGGNYLSFYVATPMWRSKYARNDTQAAYLGNLLELAHARGIGVQWSGTLMLWKTGKTSGNSIFFGSDPPPGFMESRADMLQFRDVAVEIAEELAAYDIDMYWLFEETKYMIANPHDPAGYVREHGRQAFKARYGMEPATPVRVDALADPAQHNTVFFEMDAYTEVVEAMTRAIKRINPSIIVGDSDASSTMTRIEGGPHDWERHSDFFDMQSMDIWGPPRDRYKWFRKMMRAMFNNRGASGLLSMASTRDVALSQDHQMMWGLQSLIYFGPVRVDTWAQVYDEVKKNFQFYEYTGLGDLIARGQPVKRVALLRDGDGVREDIRRGRWLPAAGETFGTEYDVRLQNVVLLPQFQCDLVMSKYFALDTIATYPALVLASCDVLSDDRVKVIESYLAQGGNVFAEGDTIVNRRLQELAGVHRTGAAREVELVMAGADEGAFRGRVTEVAAGGARVKATARDGTPILFEQAVGKGRFVYSPLWLSERVADVAVGRLFREVCDDVAGPPPLRLEGSESHRLDSNLLVSDDGLLILGVYNPTEMAIDVDLRWGKGSAPAFLTDFSRGPVVEFQGTAPLSIPPRRVIFWALGAAASPELANSTPER